MKIRVFEGHDAGDYGRRLALPSSGLCPAESGASGMLGFVVHPEVAEYEAEEDGLETD